MKKRFHIFGGCALFLFSIAFGYALVFGNSYELRISHKISDNVYPDSLRLKTTYVVFESQKKLENISLSSVCNIRSKLVKNDQNFYMFEIQFQDNRCVYRYFYLKDDDGKVLYEFKLNILSDYRLYDSFLDYDTSQLKKFRNALDNRLMSLSKYKIERKYVSQELAFHHAKKHRLYQELVYTRNIIESIIVGRMKKYAIPVEGRQLSERPTKIPNSGRPYRAGYTDGIHHGWDIDTEFGEQVIALDDGIIVRVVSEYVFSDLGRIKRGSHLHDHDKTMNLDILRGKQVWLKTMKGDVVFYSHLDDVYTSISEGQVIRRGQPIGTIGITGIPDKNYNDYHLHFAIHKNPYNHKMVGKYDFEDYMNWDWLFKGESSKYIIEHQYDVFEK